MYQVAPAAGSALLSGGGVGLAGAGTVASLGGTTSALAGLNAAGASAGVGLGLGGAGAATGGLMAGLGAAMPWLGAAMLVGSMFRKKKKVYNYSDMSRFDLDADLRSGADRGYSPMFISGTSQQSMGQQALRPLSGYDLYSGNNQMLGLSSLGAGRGFGGYGGGVVDRRAPEVAPGTPWSGFSGNAMYGSRVDVKTPAIQQATTITRGKQFAPLAFAAASRSPIASAARSAGYTVPKLF